MAAWSAEVMADMKVDHLVGLMVDCWVAQLVEKKVDMMVALWVDSMAAE